MRSKFQVKLPLQSLLYLLFFLSIQFTTAQFIPVGNGGYTKTFPGTDSAGRNSYPPGTPNLSGAAVGKPVPTNDWWSTLIKESQASNLFSYPYTMKTKNSGLVTTYIPWGVIDDIEPVTVGVTGMNASKTTVADYSDWTVTMDWNDGTHNFQAVAGIGMPFLYFTKGASDVAQITVSQGSVSIDNEMLVITDLRYGADFAVYAPVGSTWVQNGNAYTSTLNGKNYWSMAFIPLDASSVTNVANEYKKYAYVFPTNTTSSFTYDENTSIVATNFTITTDVKEGNDTDMLIGLLPHQWANLSITSPVLTSHSYGTVRGELKTMAANSFTVENTFHGILPTLPYVSFYSNGFIPTELEGKISAIQNDQLSTWTDSYNEGQVMNRLIQTARIADEMGNTASRDVMLATVKERLEDWLLAENGEVAFLFYYNTTWSAMLGYPAGHGQDSNINDHHFHWGYFIHAAAFLEQYQPGWAAQWGDMINLLVRDAASTDRADNLFPYLRNFSPYAGHCWANGFASFPNGNDQESTSESMQFNSSLIHWGEITGNTAIRDLGIYLYTTEQTAIEEYWLDTEERNFKNDQQYSLVSRVWGNSYDNGTFWTSDIAASYGIEMYPIHGGSFYLGQDHDYVTKLWNEIENNTGILANEENPNLWHDVFWEYLAFIDAEKAIDLYDSYPDRTLKFGVSDAQTYHWLHGMNALGRVDASITADYPIAAAFTQDGQTIYTAHNYTNQSLTVTFSTGYQLTVPAGKMATSIDSGIAGTLTSTFTKAAIGGSVQLAVSIDAGTVSKVEFMDGKTSLGVVTEAPFEWNATQLSLGVHQFYARTYDGDLFNPTNSVAVQVGERLPYGGTAHAIPGTIEAGMYDYFEGGNGQNISYLDVSASNAGDFRTEEYVDASSDTNEGKIVGYINSSEWLRYTVDVAEAGTYSFAFRYASGNPNGGGPFHIELDDQMISSDIFVPSTSTTDWDIWATKTVAGIELTPGKHTLKIAFSAGEFNLGKMTFTKTGAISHSYPTAVTDGNVKVVLPATSTVLTGSSSTESAGKNLSFSWRQDYGPVQAQMSNTTIADPTISGLTAGYYKFILRVTNTDNRYDEEEVFVLVTDTENAAPTVSLLSPENESTYSEGDVIELLASANDFDGTIDRVEFYEGDDLISTDNTEPYSTTWEPSSGDYVLTAKAFDNGGAEGTSQAVNVSVEQVKSCTRQGTDALQGAFEIGYKSTFETVGTDVYVTFELLDNKVGVIAYLWQESPFSESQMNHIEGKKFRAKLSGQTPNQTISYACKFAYAGGLAVTDYVDYVVGSDCDGNNDDTEAPTNFSVSFDSATSNSITLAVEANDNSGVVIYTVSYGQNTQSAQLPEGEQELTITGLSPSTNYNLSVSVADVAGNESDSNPIVVNASTTEDTNSACMGSDTEAQQGSFEVGYNYSFVTNGTSVTFTFELLDEKDGVVAYLWKQAPFGETPMSNVSGREFAVTVDNLTPGTTVSYACKFAFAGGLAVTKYFDYVVGSDCELSVGNIAELNQRYYPNPITDTMYLELAGRENKVSLQTVLGATVFEDIIGEKGSIDMRFYTPGVYILKIENEYGIQSMKIVKK